MKRSEIKIFKSDLPDILKVSAPTVKRYMNQKYYNELVEKFNYDKTTNRLSIEIVNYIHEKFWGCKYIEEKDLE